MTLHYPQPGISFEAVAEALSRQGYAVTDHFLSDAEVQLLRRHASRQLEEGSFKEAGIGKGQQLDKAVRGDYIRWIDRERLNPAGHFFLDRMEALIRYLNRHCYLGIRRQEFHFAVFPAGTGYQRHLDVFRDASDRKLSVICYLNTDWEAADGGALRMFLPGNDGKEEELDILPFGGRMVCFLSDEIEHAVLPSSRPRYSVTGWLKNGAEPF